MTLKKKKNIIPFPSIGVVTNSALLVVNTALEKEALNMLDI